MVVELCRVISVLRQGTEVVEVPAAAVMAFEELEDSMPRVSVERLDTGSRVAHNDQIVTDV